MNLPRRRSNWVSRNPDYLAIAAILLFTGAAWVASRVLPNPLLIARADRMENAARPPSWGIRDQMRQASESPRREIQRHNEEFREQCLQLREELSRAREQSQCWRSEARRLRETIRQQLRSLLCRSSNLRFG